MATAHTLNTGTVANVIVGLAGVRISTADTHPAPASQVGYTEDGVQFEYTPEMAEIMVAEENNPIVQILLTEEIKATMAMAEGSMTNLEHALMGGDGTTVANQITFGSNASRFKSFLIEGEAPGGTAGIRQILFQKAGSIGTATQSYKKGEKLLTPVEFRAYTPANGPTCTIADFWEITVGTGTFAYVATKASYRVSPETAASADDLDTVSGGSASDVMLLRGKDMTGIVTVKDDGGTPGSGTFAMADDADYLLDDLRKWINFSSDGTSWTETSRSYAY